MQGLNEKVAIKNCYLIYGEEEWLKTQFLKELQQGTVNEDDLMNYNVFEGKDIEVEKIIDACETMPFFTSYKVVIVKESGLFKQGKKDDVQKLMKWLEHLPEYVVLVFFEKEVDKRNALYKCIHKQYEVREMNCPEENELMTFFTKECKVKGIHIDSGLLGYFIKNMPKSIHYMMGELEKLKGYCGETKVTKEAIDQICVFSLEQRVFELLKAMNRKDTTEALGIYKRLIESKESPIGVLVLIARQYRQLLQVKYLVKGQRGAKQIAQEVGVPFFVAKDLEEQAKLFTFKQLQFIIELCLKSDIAIKTGKMEPTKCIEMLIVECIYVV